MLFRVKGMISSDVSFHMYFSMFIERGDHGYVLERLEN